MCVFSVVYRVFPDCPIFVLTNRDESTARPTLSPRRFDATTPHCAHWFGGADQRAGGTWLGVNEHGLLAAVTNRKTTTPPANPRSRGLLCRDVLERSSAESALEWVRTELAVHEYAGFNLILLTSRSAFVLEHADEPRIHALEPGVHTIGNGHLDAADDGRVQRSQKQVEALANAGQGEPWTESIEQAEAICRLHAEPGVPGICLHDVDWGTIGSTIIGLPLDVSQSVYHYAAGPPCSTAYVDYSQSLRDLLVRS
jgi:uncharacterized protein with NRDE domain